MKRLKAQNVKKILIKVIVVFAGIGLLISSFMPFLPYLFR